MDIRRSWWEVTYKYKSPTEYGYEKFEVKRNEHNKALYNRKRNIFTKIEGYYKREKIILHYTTNSLGKALAVVMLPVKCLLHGLLRRKDIASEYSALHKEKEKGKFLTEALPRVLHDGSINDNFIKFKVLYERQYPNKYILWVTVKDDEGGYGSRWYGWLNSLTFTYEEALKEKEKIKENYYDVEVVEV